MVWRHGTMTYDIICKSVFIYELTCETQ